MLAAIGPTELWIAVLIGILGCSIGLWLTRVFWMDAVTGQPGTLMDRIKVGVLFLLSGTVPTAVQAAAVGVEGSALTLAAFAGGSGIGLLLGFVVRSSFVAEDLFCRIIALRIRVGAGNPSPEEAFAFGMRFGTGPAALRLGMSQNSFDALFQVGAAILAGTFGGLGLLQRRVVLDALCGVPITQIARDWALNLNGVVQILDSAL